MTTIPCPKCNGTGDGGHAFVSSATSSRTMPVPCLICLGTGKVSIDVARWIPVGEQHRKARVAEGISILERAAALGITPTRLSAMENGRADPAMLEEME